MTPGRERAERGRRAERQRQRRRDGAAGGAVGAGRDDGQVDVAGDGDAACADAALPTCEVAGHVRDADLELAGGVGRAEVAHAVTAVAGHVRVRDRRAGGRWWP